MKKIFIMLLMMSGLVFSQQPVKTQPLAYSETLIMDDQAINTSTVWSDSWYTFFTYGVATIFIDTISTSSLGNITVEIQTWSDMLGKWTNYYSGNDALTITVANAEWPININPTKFNQFVWGVKSRIGLTTASGSAVVDVSAGGQ